jgi:CHAT domain
VVTEPTLESLREARDALDAVIAEIRLVEGFESFLAPPEFADISAAATECPVVYLAAADPGGIALVVRGDDVIDLDLPHLTRGAVASRAQAYNDVYARYQPDAEAGAAEWEQVLLEITDWLWTAAMEAVVQNLLRHAPEDGSGPPRAVLIPGGLLGLLPLHAAWRPEPSRPTGREYALDVVQVAYAPNARALTAARQVARDVPGRRVAAVAAPPQAADLPMTVVEARAAALAFPGGAALVSATAETFLDRLREVDVVHVGCHGEADLAEPLQSRLELTPGEDVTLATLMGQQLRIRLAVLSACETLLPGTELPDEVVSLPTGLIQAGAAGVIASMWAVPDLASTVLMIEFYGHWRQTPDDPGAALRRAQIWVRDTSLHDQLDHYRQATRSPRWPPRAIARELAAALTEAELRTRKAGRPVDRPLDELSGWAAFAHVGV